MQSASAGLAYATKGNILLPGTSGEATTVQNNAASRLNEVLRSSPYQGAPTAPSVDSGDLIVTNDETAAAGSVNRRLDQ